MQGYLLTMWQRAWQGGALRDENHEYAALHHAVSDMLNSKPELASGQWDELSMPELRTLITFVHKAKGITT